MSSVAGSSPVLNRSGTLYDDSIQPVPVSVEKQVVPQERLDDFSCAQIAFSKEEKETCHAAPRDENIVNSPKAGPTKVRKRRRRCQPCVLAVILLVLLILTAVAAGVGMGVSKKRNHNRR